MSETKHTPGPWEWTDTSERTPFMEGQLRGMFGEHPATYPILNRSLRAIDAATVSVYAANARLIAAAPDLLEALQALAEACEHEHLRRIADAAISKATGAKP